MKAFLLAALVATGVQAEDWKITPEVRKACADAGGCILTIPDGQLIPASAVQQAFQEAFEAGQKEGAKTCKRREI